MDESEYNFISENSLFCMARRIPPSLKRRVVKEWLEGIPRNTIAENCEIGYASVTNIISQARGGEIMDIDLLREVALTLKKENISLTYFAHVIRLKHICDELNLSEDHIESFLDKISTHCIDNDIEERDFINRISSVCYVSEMLEIPLVELPEYLYKKTEIDEPTI